MSYFPDLSNWCQAGHGADVRAVGWLDLNHPFPKGTVPPPFVERLQQHLENPVEFVHFMGSHRCQFCPAPTPLPGGEGADEEQESPEPAPDLGSGESRPTPVPSVRTPCVTCGDSSPESGTYCGQCGARSYLGHWRQASGCRNLLVPSANAVYIAPEMILHYIRGHSYRPPAEFVEATLQCPEQGSEDFMALLGQFKPKWDSMFFDRNAWVKREQSMRGVSLWSVNGMCFVCGQFIYLYYDEETPAHCGQPLPHFTRRHYDDSGKMIAETTGGSPHAQTQIDLSALGMGSWTAKGMCRTCGYWVYVKNDCPLPMHCGEPLINTVYRKSTTGTPQP